MHGHLGGGGGAVLPAVAAGAALLAGGEVAAGDHVHGVHAAVGQVLPFGECPAGGGGAEQASLGLLRAGRQAGRGGEVVSVEVVGVVQRESVVRALLHVVMAAAEHVGGGRGGARRRGDRRGGGGARARLHHVLELGGREGAQLAAVAFHLGSATATASAAVRVAPGHQRGSPLGQEGVGGLGGVHGAPARLQAAVGGVGQPPVALKGTHGAAGAGRVLAEPQVAELALPAAHVEAVGRQVEGGRRAGGGEQVGRPGWGGGPVAGGGGGGPGAAPWADTNTTEML